LIELKFNDDPNYVDEYKLSMFSDPNYEKVTVSLTEIISSPSYGKIIPFFIQFHSSNSSFSFHKMDL
jgi:hypothetical protein